MHHTALRYMADESHLPIKVSDVVTHTLTSHRSLVRHFQQVRGRTIVEELARMRIGRVKRQLVESDMPIKEIAASCGFTSSNRLCDPFPCSNSPQAHR
jgi:LacI family transcriptional regulator